MNICIYDSTNFRYYKSFHGGDFKILSQIAPFLLWDYINSDQKKVCLALSKVACSYCDIALLKFMNIFFNIQVFRAAYCSPYYTEKEEVRALCQNFVDQWRRKTLVVGGAVNLGHAHFSLKPRPFCVFNAVGQEFVGCSYEKTNGKSSSVCFTATYS